MATKTVTASFQLRKDTAANWSSKNPVLLNGEPGYDTTNNILKIGNGITAWNNLAAIAPGYEASLSNILMNGTASVGSTNTMARGNHRHPTDTTRQAALVSGTNIKTINGNSILGSGNLSIGSVFGSIISTSLEPGFTLASSMLNAINGNKLIAATRCLSWGGNIDFTSKGVYLSYIKDSFNIYIYLFGQADYSGYDYEPMTAIIKTDLNGKILSTSQYRLNSSSSNVDGIELDFKILG